MSDQLVVEAIGVRVGLDVRGPLRDQARAAIERAWDRCLTQTAPADVVVRVLAGPVEDAAQRQTSDRVVAADDVDRVMHDLSQAVTQQALAERAGSVVLLHAAALADPATGRAVVCVAPSGTGKTTLCRTLGREWGYVTDETVSVDAEGVIAPYPKPLSVWREPERRVKDQVSATELGLGPCPPRVEVGAVLWLDRHDAAAPDPVVEEVETAEALTTVATQTSGLARTPRPLHTLAAVLGRAGGLRRVRYREAATLVDLLPGLVAPPPAGPGLRARPRPLLDAYAEGGVLTVMREDRVATVSSLAAAVLELLPAGRWTPAEALGRALEEQWGQAPDGAALSALLDALADAGLVEVDAT